MEKGWTVLIGCIGIFGVFLLVLGHAEALSFLGLPYFSSGINQNEIFYVEDMAVPTDKSLREDFEILYQNPELPTGCEITAMTSVLNYYGFGVDKLVMARHYLPTWPYELYEGGDGRVYGPDLNRYFIGDPEGTGYICGPEAIITAANQYLSETGSRLRAVNQSGVDGETLYRWVSEGMPVVVWITIGMNPRYPEEGWYTEKGDYVDWSRNDHCAVLIGCDDRQVMLADPISGYVVYDKSVFENSFYTRGSRCVALM